MGLPRGKQIVLPPCTQETAGHNGRQAGDNTELENLNEIRLNRCTSRSFGQPGRGALDFERALAFRAHWQSEG